MRTVRISCDRCGREITGYPVKIAPEYVDRESGEVWPDTGEKLPEWAEKLCGKDFCESCVEKVVRYALGGMKVNPEFEQAVQEMVKNDAPPDEEDKNEYGNQDTDCSKEEKPGRVKIDTGKIMALTKAGWSAAQIADEMHINTQAVYDARYRLKKEGRL